MEIDCCNKHSLLLCLAVSTTEVCDLLGPVLFGRETVVNDKAKLIGFLDLGTHKHAFATALCYRQSRIQLLQQVVGAMGKMPHRTNGRHRCCQPSCKKLPAVYVTPNILKAHFLTSMGESVLTGYLSNRKLSRWSSSRQRQSVSAMHVARKKRWLDSRERKE